MGSEIAENAARVELARITATILELDSGPVQLLRACQDLYLICAKTSGHEDNRDLSPVGKGSSLVSGLAISPNEAARCIWDFARTTAFMRGVKAAIDELLVRFPGEPIEVLYAGCGPFAPLIIPLLENYDPQLLRVTVLDYHQESLDSVNLLMGELKLDEYAVTLVQADALHYLHPVKPHLVICEMMQTALRNEPQVAVTFNLAPQVREGGIFVPQKIWVEVVLAETAREVSFDQSSRKRILLGTILELDSARCDHETLGQPTIVEIPSDLPSGTDLRILTKVQVFSSFKLNDYDAAITYPVVLRQLESLRAGDRIEFVYVLDGRPRFEFKRL
ncbi:MAG: hypothetical protein ABIP75_20030 [Pyrinomonadaceae bacterium]